MREKRLYAFVPYQLTGIQKGIQMAHAVVEYALKHSDRSDFQEWKKDWKTIIVLDGGSTRNFLAESPYGIKETIGTMQETFDLIKQWDIPVTAFWEPDLNDAMTAFCFVADEPVFNHKDFPLIHDYVKDEMEHMEWLDFWKSGNEPTLDDFAEAYPELFKQWLTTLHEDDKEAEKIAALKYILLRKKLASN